MNQNIIIATATKLMVPFIILFGLYVQFHGDFGPGGGFQAGVIIAVGFILYGIVFGLQRLEAVAPFDYLRVFAGLGALIYGGTGIVTQMLGGRFLDYNQLSHDPVHGQHYGIFAIELGVGLTVASVMIMIFMLFNQRKPSMAFKKPNTEAETENKADVDQNITNLNNVSTSNSPKY